MTLFLVLGTVLFVLQLRWGVVGIHGGGVERAANPPLYWLAITMMATCLGILAYLHFTGR